MTNFNSSYKRKKKTLKIHKTLQFRTQNIGETVNPVFTSTQARTNWKKTPRERTEPKDSNPRTQNPDPKKKSETPQKTPKNKM